MKKITTLLTLAMTLVSLTFTACGKKGEVKIETAKLEKMFESAEPGIKNGVDAAVAAVKNADYAGALAKLQSVASEVKLTPEQKSAVNDLIEQVKAAMAGMADKAVEGANKAATDLQKSLGK